MPLNRRNVIKLFTAAGVSLGLPYSYGTPSIKVEKNIFDGEGVYLYPTWGDPHPYLVKRIDSHTLGFYSAEHANLLWQQSLDSNEAIFAGKLSIFNS